MSTETSVGSRQQTLSGKNRNELFVTLVLETTFSQVLLGQVSLQVAQSCMWSERAIITVTHFT